MKNILVKFPLVISVALLFCCVGYSFAEAKSEINKNWRGLAIKGYDPVAYHTTGEPLEGSSQFEIEWKDATWRFASEGNRDLFKANPGNYAPRYGGYCAWAVSRGYTANVDPENAWSVVDGKLYLNYSAAVKETWEQDIHGNIEKADANWPGVLE